MPISLTSKFCCFPLETGVKYWGWIGTVLCGIAAIFNFVMMIVYEEKKSDVPIEKSSFDRYLDDAIVSQITAHWILLIMSLGGMVTSYMLVMAINQVNNMCGKH